VEKPIGFCISVTTLHLYFPCGMVSLGDIASVQYFLLSYFYCMFYISGKKITPFDEIIKTQVYAQLFSSQTALLL
jgi:hypothetical protein